MRYKYTKIALSFLIVLFSFSCEKPCDNIHFEDLYKCKATLNLVDHEGDWSLYEAEEEFILRLAFLSEDELRVFKVAGLNYGDYYFSENSNTYEYSVSGDSIVPIESISNIGITEGVFSNDKSEFNFTHFTYKIGSPPDIGEPIWYPIDENFYCVKND